MVDNYSQNRTLAPCPYAHCRRSSAVMMISNDPPMHTWSVVRDDVVTWEKGGAHNASVDQLLSLVCILMRRHFSVWGSLHSWWLRWRSSMMGIIVLIRGFKVWQIWRSKQTRSRSSHMSSTSTIFVMIVEWILQIWLRQPITAFSKTGVVFQWGEECQEYIGTINEQILQQQKHYFINYSQLIKYLLWCFKYGMWGNALSSDW